MSGATDQMVMVWDLVTCKVMYKAATKDLLSSDVSFEENVYVTLLKFDFFRKRKRRQQTIFNDLFKQLIPNDYCPKNNLVFLLTSNGFHGILLRLVVDIVSFFSI